VAAVEGRASAQVKSIAGLPVTVNHRRAPCWRARGGHGRARVSLIGFLRRQGSWEGCAFPGTA